MSEDLLTSSQVAELLGVAPASVKRWADAGILRCVKTAGGHRRFLTGEVNRFRTQEFAGHNAENASAHWLKLLLAEDDIHRIVGALYSARARFGAWWRVAESLGEVLEFIGQQWANGAISILQEHLASERLSRGLNRCCEAMPSHPEALRCLLISSEGDDHVLGLSLAELCFREAGLVTSWVGRNTPLDEVLGFLSQSPVDVLAVSASVASSPESLAHQARRLVSFCEAQHTTLLLGGRGPWPDGLSHAARIRSFRDLHQWLSQPR